MKIDSIELCPLSMSLFRFAGHEVRPVGQITLPFSLGEEPLRKTRSTLFTIMEASSSYNIILGRPTLSALKVVASAYYQKVKFPVG